MPWKVLKVDEQRQALCYQIVAQGRSVSQAAREAGVSRKTMHKWLKLYRREPGCSLADRSRRPRSSPKRTVPEIESAVLAIRDGHRWGARKIRKVLFNRGLDVPSIRTVTAVLGRHGRIEDKAPVKPAVDPAPGRFERDHPNSLWQLDHKGPLEIGRVRHHPLTVVDDHSRYCLCFEPLPDKTLETAWPVLWRIFGDYGLPGAILSDGAFASDRHGVSVFDQRLLRLGITPIHGRAYHPQTQGKVERLHGTLDYELLDFNGRRDCLEHFRVDRDAWCRTYNLLRPHESLGDEPPIGRYRRSLIPRPACALDDLPKMVYPSGSVLRWVSQVGDIQFRRVRIALSRSIARQEVRVDDGEHEVKVYYGPKLLRVIHHDQLAGRRHNQVT